MDPERETATVERAPRPPRWRRRLAFAIVGGAVLLSFYNLVADQRVSRYEATAAREAGTPYLQRMAPRELGPKTGATGAVLFVHGFIGSPSNFADLPDRAAALGWHARVMTLPGHGTSPRDFERASASEISASVLRELRELKAHYRPVVLVGHSMGGALATIASAEEPVDGLVLCSPYFGLTLSDRVGFDVERLLRPASTLLRWVPRGPDSRPVRKESNKPFVDAYNWIPSQGGVVAAEIRDLADPRRTGPAITAPLLLIHARDDTVTSARASEAALPHFASAQKEALWLYESDHVIFWDYDGPIVREAVVHFLKEVASHVHHQPGIRE